MMLNGYIHDGTILIDVLQDVARGFRVLIIFTQCCFEIFDNFGRGTLGSFPLDPPQFLRCQPFRKGSIRAFTDFRRRHRPETIPRTIIPDQWCGASVDSERRRRLLLRRWWTSGGGCNCSTRVLFMETRR